MIVKGGCTSDEQLVGVPVLDPFFPRTAPSPHRRRHRQRPLLQRPLRHFHAATLGADAPARCSFSTPVLSSPNGV